MAKFHGFEIKNFKTFQGMEGYGSQGDVWLNGKKLGFWSNDGNGGMDRFSFPTAELDTLIAKQVPECSYTYKDNVIEADLSMLLAHLADMKDIEKQWKKADKQGRALVVLTQRGGYGEQVLYHIRKSGDVEHLMEMAFETAAEVAAEEGLGDCSKDVYYDKSCFVIGEPLKGADNIVKNIVQKNKEREKRYAEIFSR